jgi:hypothetical protein
MHVAGLCASRARDDRPRFGHGADRRYACSEDRRYDSARQLCRADSNADRQDLAAGLPHSIDRGLSRLASSALRRSATHLPAVRAGRPECVASDPRGGVR